MKWNLEGPDTKRTITPRGRISANHTFALKQAAIEGLGFAVVANFMVEDELKNKKLQVVCPNWQLQGAPAQLVFPAQKFLPPKLRHFIDFAVDNFIV